MCECKGLLNRYLFFTFARVEQNRNIEYNSENYSWNAADRLGLKMLNISWIREQS